MKWSDNAPLGISQDDRNWVDAVQEALYQYKPTAATVMGTAATLLYLVMDESKMTEQEAINWIVRMVRSIRKPSRGNLRG